MYPVDDLMQRILPASFRRRPRNSRAVVRHTPTSVARPRGDGPAIVIRVAQAMQLAVGAGFGTVTSRPRIARFHRFQAGRVNCDR